MNRLRGALRVAIMPANLRRTILIAVLVGAWLTGVNEGDQLVHAGLGAALIPKVALNFLTPFVVANLGLLARSDAPAGIEARP